MNTFCAGDECVFAPVMDAFCASDELVENASSIISPIHTQLHCSYQRISNRTSLEGGNQRCSPSKTGSSYMYHALVLTSEYATPTNYIHVHNSTLLGAQPPRLFIVTLRCHVRLCPPKIESPIIYQCV